jgi:TonB family protein
MTSDLPGIDSAQIRASLPAPALGTQLGAPPPPIETTEKPKLTFERPGATTGTPAGAGRIQVPRPTGTVEEAARQAARSGGRGLIVGDEDAVAGASPSSPSVPIPGKLGSAVELLSDPMGADFWPYLVKVLSAVRRNWFAVIPESARFGRAGRTTIQFAINKDGSVPKLVIAAPSGTEALDRAAVAGISASNPFPPLPPEYRGSQVRLQFVFKYNVK